MQGGKSDDLSSTPETHMMERENQALKVVLQSRKKKAMDSKTKINTVNIFYVRSTTLYSKTEPSL